MCAHLISFRAPLCVSLSNAEISVLGHIWTGILLRSPALIFSSKRASFVVVFEKIDISIFGLIVPAREDIGLGVC